MCRLTRSDKQINIWSWLHICHLPMCTLAKQAKSGCCLFRMAGCFDLTLQWLLLHYLLDLPPLSPHPSSLPTFPPLLSQSRLFPPRPLSLSVPVPPLPSTPPSTQELQFPQPKQWFLLCNRQLGMIISVGTLSCRLTLRCCMRNEGISPH